MCWMSDIAQNHSKWVELANYFGGGEDDVQDMYIKLYKYKNGQNINDAYIFFTLRSVVATRQKIESRITTVDISDMPIEDDSFNDLEQKLNEEKRIEFVDQLVSSLHWYDSKLFKIYRDTGMSYRKIAKETGISYVSIFNTIKNVKQTILKEHGKKETA